MGYTPFAVLAALLIMSIATSQVDEINQDPISQQHRYSVQSNIEDTQVSYATRSLQTLADISRTEEVDNFDQALNNLTINSTYKDKEQEIGLKKLQKHIKQDSGKINNIRFNSINTQVRNLSIYTKSQLDIMYDGYNSSIVAERENFVSGIDDPLLEGIGDKSTIDPCSHRNLGKKVAQGNYAGTARGKPIIEPTNPVSETNKNTKIILATDITDYTPSTVSDFAGYASQTTPPSPEAYNNNYVTGISIPTVTQNQNIIIEEGLWKSNIFKTIKEDCYLKTSRKETPSIKDRIEDSSTGSTNQGIYTVINTTQTGTDSSKSNIGYERVDTPSDLVSIAGVTSGDGIQWPYFKISRSTAETSGIQGLIQ